MIKTEYDLFIVSISGHVDLAKTFSHKSEALLAFGLVVKDGKMRAAFLDQREEFSDDTRSVVNVKKWRKRAYKTKGQSR